MAFDIEVTYSNGYRCCCTRTWEYNESKDTLEEALQLVPVELVDGDPLQFNGDMEVTEVEVVDTDSGEMVAWARAQWSQGYGRGSGYKYTRWTGYRPDTGKFEIVYSGQSKKIEETWDQVLARLAETKRQQDLVQAERDLADAQARVSRLGSPATGTE